MWFGLSNSQGHCYQRGKPILMETHIHEEFLTMGKPISEVKEFRHSNEHLQKCTIISTQMKVRIQLWGTVYSLHKI